MESVEKRKEKYIESLQGEKRAIFEEFRKLLLSYNEKYNLTAITEEKEVFYKHFLDSVMGESFFPKNSSVVEVGSGAGFPSIPLKLLRDDLSFTLIESTGKKCEFLKVVVDKLGLSNVKISNLRAEDCGKSVSQREKYDVCCARAVARLNTLAEYCLPLVKVGGRWVAYKGRADEELFEGKRAIQVLGGGNVYTEEYELCGYGERTLVVVEKKRETPEKYPRGNGKERKQPIL